MKQVKGRILKLTKNIMLISAILLWYSCNNRNIIEDVNKVETIYVDYKKALKTINYDEIVDSLSYIPLEKTKPFVGSIKKMIIYMDKLVIWDYKGKCVWVFDDSGNFKARIHNIGKGPTEYLTIEDVSVSSEGVISIVDVAQGSVLKYSIEGGFLSKKKHEGQPSNYLEKGGYEYVFNCAFSKYDGKSYHLTAEKEGQQTQRYFNATHYWFFNPIDRFYPLEDSVFFYNNFDHYIYVFNALELKKKYRIKFGDLELDDVNMRISESMTIKDYRKIRDHSFYVGESTNLTISRDHILFSYVVPKNDFVVCLYNRHSKKSISYKNAISPVNDFNPLISKCTDGKYHYAFMEPYNMDEELRKTLVNKFQRDINAMSNPLVVQYLYTFK